MGSFGNLVTFIVSMSLIWKGGNTQIVVNCTFENDMCDMTLIDPPLTPVRWIRSSSAAIKQAAKPPADHTRNSRDGHYLFFDGSISTSTHHLSRVLLSNITVTNPSGTCLRLSHVMFGMTGTLSVFVDMCDNTMFLWSASESHWSKWITTNVTIPAWIRNFGLIFEAKRHSSGDVGISLDDVIITDSPCPGPSTLPPAATTTATTTPVVIPTTPSPTTIPPRECPTTPTANPANTTTRGPVISNCLAEFCDKDTVTCRGTVASKGFFCQCSGGSTTTKICYRQLAPISSNDRSYVWIIPTTLLVILLVVVIILFVVAYRRRKDIKLIILMLRQGNASQLYNGQNRLFVDEWDGKLQDETVLDSNNKSYNDSRLNRDPNVGPQDQEMEQRYGPEGVLDARSPTSTNANSEGDKATHDIADFNLTSETQHT